MAEAVCIAAASGRGARHHGRNANGRNANGRNVKSKHGKAATFRGKQAAPSAPVYAGRFDPITDRSGCGPFCRRHRPANKPCKHRAARRKRRTTSIPRLRPQGHCNGFRCSACARAGRRRRHGESDQGPRRPPRRTEAIRRKTRSTRRKPGTSGPRPASSRLCPS